MYCLDCAVLFQPGDVGSMGLKTSGIPYLPTGSTNREPKNEPHNFLILLAGTLQKRTPDFRKPPHKGGCSATMPYSSLKIWHLPFEAIRGYVENLQLVRAE